MGRNLLDGEYIEIKSQEYFNKIQNGRANYGKFDGPGWYLKLNYREKCPKGCCYDDVVELLSSDDVIIEVQDKMKEYADLLKQSKKYTLAYTNQI